MAPKKYYAVAIGRRPGVYTQWYGDAGAWVQVNGFQGARYKAFATASEAHAFIRQQPLERSGGPERHLKRASLQRPKESVDTAPTDRIVIYTDGSSLGNPGPGGYGVVIPSLGPTAEWSGGFRRTTNNRMELLACIVGLEQLEVPSAVDLYSDSRYVVDGITRGWARGWQRNRWRKSDGAKALNVDLWQRLLALCDRHAVRFVWVRGHAGNPGNERCDRLASQAALGRNLPADTGYEAARPEPAGSSLSVAD
jgi:ribonuclease HI